MDPERWTARQRDALLGMVPIVTLVVSPALGAWLASILGLPEWLGVIAGIVLAVGGFFVSRAILRRGFAHRAL